MNPNLLKLNPQQRAAVDTRGHCLVIACPGSGKTSTAATKAAVLLEEGDTVCAVTFTKDAALELRERIVAQAGKHCADRLLVGTFHSICLLMAFPQKASTFGRTILRNHQSPFTEEWEIVNAGVQNSLVDRAIRAADVKLKRGDALAIIELAKEKGSVDHLTPELQDLVNSYIEAMQRHRKIDFQDIILKTNLAMRQGTLLPLAVGSLLVDEFQDTDAAQLEWIVHHGQAGAAITAVGDDDQSIYAFRRALGYDGMNAFTSDFGSERILLGTNYRCHSEILEAAERLISRNTDRIAKRLHAAKGEGGMVSWESFPNTAEEASAVAQEASLALEDDASFAVIARTNKELIEIQKALLLRDIPFRKADGKSIFDYHEVQTFGAVMRTLVKPTANDIDMVLGWAGVAESDVKALREMFPSSIAIGAPQDFAKRGVTKDGMEVWRRFAKRHGEWLDALKMGMGSLVNMGIYDWMLESIQKGSSEKLLEIAQDFFDPKDKTIAQHLADLKIAERKAKMQDGKDSETVQKSVLLTTAHSSKGLEFDRVWIVGVETGSFPSENSSLSEERRLMFVAFTRARNFLWVSGTGKARPSVFVYEAGLLREP